MLASLFALTAAGLALEVTLTRLFSLLFVQSYVYMVISVSVSGIGLGAVLMYYVPAARRVGFIGLLSLLPPVLLAALLGAAVGTGGSIPAMILTFGIYAALGAAHVQIFRASGIAVSRLYAADLIGAATGSVAAFFVLNGLGGVYALVLVGSVLAAGLAGSYASFSRRYGRALTAAGLVAALAVASAALPLQSMLLPNASWNKEMTAMLQDDEADAEITETRWSAFGRVDMVETNNPLFRTMFIDGGAGTKMVRMDDGRVSRSVAETLLFQYMGGIPILATEESERRRAAVLGSGGGIDVVTLLVAGFDEIDAIEINPDFVDLVRDHGDYTGGIYADHERVNVHVGEGRAFLRNSEARYDVILMGLPIIKSVRNFGNHALTENYLFTYNAFGEYRRALDDGGMLVVIAHYRNELLRLVSNAVRAFEADGLTAAAAGERMVILADLQNPTLVVKNEPFTDAERRVFTAILETIPTQRDLNFVPGASPEIARSLAFNSELSRMAGGSSDLETFQRAGDENISWISDDSPFFYQLTSGIPREMTVVLVVVAALIVGVTLLFLLQMPKDRNGTAAASPSPTDAPAALSASIPAFAAFALIGLGFMMVEIAILQKFIVFWQHQTLALAVVLSAVLVSTGVGSLLSRRLRGPRSLGFVLVPVVLLLVASAWLLEPLLRSVEHAGPIVKILLTLALTTPVFLPLGMVFPTLLRRTTRSLYPWMMGVNSITSLAGGTVALVVALTLGYRMVMLVGTLAYLLLIGILLTRTVGATPE